MSYYVLKVPELPVIYLMLDHNIKSFPVNWAKRKTHDEASHGKSKLVSLANNILSGISCTRSLDFSF